MTCSTCSRSIADGSRFCPYCGSTQAPPADAVAPPAPPTASDVLGGLVATSVLPRAQAPPRTPTPAPPSPSGRTSQYGTIQLLPNERELASVRGSQFEVALTDARVVSRETSFGGDAEWSIPLAHVDSVFVGTSRRSWLLVGSFVLGGYSVYSLDSGLPMIPLLGAVLLFTLWWFLARRGAVITSTSGQTKIALSAGAAGLDAVTDFVAAVNGEVARRGQYGGRP